MSTSDMPLGVAVIGCGALGKAHAEGWQEVHGAKVVTVFDVDASRAQALADQTGAQATGDLSTAIEHSDVNVVSVATPSFYHPEACVLAAGRGKHILCEKPVALDRRGAKQIAKAVRDSSIKFELGMQRRYGAQTPKVIEIIRSGPLGRPLIHHLFMVAEIRPKIAMHDARRGNGGPIIDMGPHWFDIWSLFFGSRPAAVTARGFVFAKDRPELASIEQVAIDTGALIVEYESGDAAAWTISWGLAPGSPWITFQAILGPKALLKLEGQRLTLIPEGGQAEDLGEFPDGTKTEQVKAFAQCIRDDTPPRVPLEAGMVALEASLGTLESMHTGQRVSLGHW